MEAKLHNGLESESVFFDFCGIDLEVTAESVPWIDRMVRAFPDLVRNARSRQSKFSLKFSEKPIAAPAEPLEPTWEGRMNDGNDGRIFETETAAVLEVKDGGVLVIDHAGRTASAHFRPGSYSRFFGNAVMLVVDAILNAGGQQLLHAACLVDKKSGRSILVTAPSGGGKTSTSLALAGGGFRLMTDDASVLVPAGSAPLAWGLPRTLKVHRKTAELLPWLGPMPDQWDEEGEQGLAIDNLPDRIEMAPIEPAPLGAIIALGPRSHGKHTIQRIEKAQMLIELALENVAWHPSGMVPKAVSQFVSLGQTVASVPTYRICAGPDLDSLAPMVAEIVNADRAA